MAPGPELNEKIAVELLGLTVEQYRQKSLDYSAYLVPAFQHVVGAMIGRGYTLRVRPAPGTRNMVIEFGMPGTTTSKRSQAGQLVGIEDQRNLAVAICRAALIAVAERASGGKN
jgi:hypothetical protein